MFDYTLRFVKVRIRIYNFILSRFRCSLGNLFGTPFRHRTLVFLNEMDVAPLGACSSSIPSQRDCSKTLSSRPARADVRRGVSSLCEPMEKGQHPTSNRRSSYSAQDGHSFGACRTNCVQRGARLVYFVQTPLLCQTHDPTSLGRVATHSPDRWTAIVVDLNRLLTLDLKAPKVGG